MRIVISLTIAVAAGLVLLAACGGSGEEATPTPNASTPTPTSTLQSADVDAVNCSPLLTQDEVDDALGWSTGDDRPGPIETARGEVCLHSLLRDNDVFVQIQPGQPGDFEPGASVIGVSGEPVTGVGDDALWFGGEGSEAGGDVGALSVRQDTKLGALHFRIFLGRPDLTSAEQLEVAKIVALAALPRFPGVEVELPEPKVVTFEREPVDLSDVSYVDNLLVKEEAGEWTRGEGLVATLKLAAGELDAESVLRHDELLSYEGTGVFKMANEYLDDGPDAAARAEITRLLGLLVFSNEQLEAMAGITQPAAAHPGRLAVGAARAQETDCTKFFNDYTVPAGVGQCLEFKFYSLDEEVFTSGPQPIRIFFPASPLPTAGWIQKHYDLAVAAVAETWSVYEKLGKMPPAVNVVFSVSDGGGFLAAAAAKAGQPCGFVVFTSMQSLSEGDFKQTVAHELAHCFQEETFTEQNKVDYSIIKWREEGLADYLSNVVYPSNDLEWDVLTTLAQWELDTTLFQRAYTNFIFFQYLENIIGRGGIFGLVNSLPTAGGLGGQADKLAQFGGIETLYHDFARAMTDETVVDTSGGTIRYDVRADMVPVGGPMLILDEPKRFGLVRLHLIVDPGKYACVEYDWEGELLASWRDGDPGSPGGSWSEDLPATLQNDTIFVVTTTEDGATFGIEVLDVDDDEDCQEDPEEDKPIPTLCPLECPPSEYYYRGFGVAPE